MPDILFWPPLPTRAQLADQLFRSVWHFLPALKKFDRLVFPYAGEDFPLLDVDQMLAMAQIYLSRDLDPAIADHAPKFAGKIAVIEDAAADPARYTGPLAGVIVWHTGEASLNAAARAIADRTGAELVWADIATIQQETLQLIRFVFTLFPKKEIDELLSRSVYLFFEHLKRWKDRPVSAFGNGPSLQKVVEERRDPGATLRMICNSTIGDPAALDHLKPEIIFCGDPVQHAGCSLYAGQFRRDLVAAMAGDSRRVLITQLGFVPYFRSVLPSQVHDRIVGVGNDRNADFNVDLTKSFYTAATANIFTMLVLPIAFTISKSVDIYGCDGQAFAQATKPWGHAQEGDYMSKMAVTHRVHPAFWQRNYAEELISYYNDMEDLLTTAEKAGVTARARTSSYVPALAKRFHP
ncbi:MAG: hypothetical protein FJX59_19185 [Alphaproteobacteria bacterium]|nr:hypothetical protein [Alphaproteobacteria bacterium]